MKLKIHRIDASLELPSYAYPGDAGLDLASAVDFELAPFERMLVPTGLALAIPEGYAGFIQPRSGMSYRTGLTVINTPGLIDSAYRGEIKVPMINLDPEQTVSVHKGERVAQLVIQAVEHAEIIEVDVLDETERGDGGFGSSGL